MQNDELFAEVAPHISRYCKAIERQYPRFSGELETVGLLAAWQRLKQFDPEKGNNHIAWAKKGAKFAVMNEIRKGLKELHYFSFDMPIKNEKNSDEQILLGETIPDKQLDLNTKHFVRQLLPILSTQEQLVIVLHDLYGYTLEEIIKIEANHMTVQGVKAVRDRALEKMRKEIYAQTGNRREYFQNTNRKSDPKILGEILN